jgi:hypothetical protein
MAYINYRLIAKAKGSPTNQIQDISLEIPDVSEVTVGAALVALVEKAQKDALRAKNYPHTGADQYSSPYAWLKQHLQYLTLTQSDGSLVSYLFSGAFLWWWEVEAAIENKIFDAPTRTELKRRFTNHTEQEQRWGGPEASDEIYVGLVATGFKGQCVTWQSGDRKITDLGAVIENLDPERANWLKTLTDFDEIDPAFLG